VWNFLVVFVLISPGHKIFSSPFQGNMKNKGLLSAVLAPFFIAMSIMVVKLAGNGAPPLVIAGLGPLLSIPFLLLLQLTSSAPLNLMELLRPPLLSPFMRVVVTRSIIGQILIITGFSLTTGVKSVLLLRLEPLFVVLWAVLLRHEKPGARKLILLMLLVIGSALVVAPGASGASSIAASAPNLGDLMIVSSLLFFSYSYIPTQEVVAQSNPAAINLLGNLLGGAFITLTALVVCGPGGFHMSINTLLLILAYSFVFFACGCTLYFYAFKALQPWVIASFLSLEVVFGLVLAFLILHEQMSCVQLMGAMTVCLAMIGIARLNQAESR
jgi:drug/metabolite transporter (DMT)-like permease